MIDILYAITDSEESTNIFKAKCIICDDVLEVPDKAVEMENVTYTVACLCYSEGMGICLEVNGRVGEVKGKAKHCMLYNDKLKQFVRL